MAFTTLSQDYEKRPLKRLKLGPPDVYFQDPKQKEDDLNANHLKAGFSNTPFAEESGSERDNVGNIQKELILSLSKIKQEKDQLDTYVESSKKRQAIHKDLFWVVTQRNRMALRQWMLDLSNGSKCLSNLGKHVPIFPKKDELYAALVDYEVPLLRAAWLLKMASAQSASHNESAKKIRVNRLLNNDPVIEWTQSLCRFLREHFVKIHNSETRYTETPSEEVEWSRKAWHYGLRFTKYLCEENMLDKHEFLTWVLEVLEKEPRSSDDPYNKLCQPLLYYHLEDFIQCQSLSRRLSFFCATKLFAIFENSTNGTYSILRRMRGNPFADCLNCPHHRSMVVTMSCVIQAVTLCCPSALVWVPPPDCKFGSPLDILPLAPSELPTLLPESSPDYVEARAALEFSEGQIRSRSQAVEQRWNSDKCSEPSSGYATSRVLAVLEALDRHDFEKVDLNNSIDILYNRVFNAGRSFSQSGTGTPESNGDGPSSDFPTVRFLCEWATTVQRVGVHRAFAVTKLLEKRQDYYEKLGATNSGIYLFQSCLVKFLDDCAPVLNANPTFDERQSFHSCLILFCELIHADLFSHDAYMQMLISRGDLSTGSLLNASQPLPRHLLYTLHIPLVGADEDDSSRHLINQRMILLYGLGKAAREENSSNQRQAVKELNRVLTQKGGSKMKLDEYFKQLSIYDRQVALASAAPVLLTQLSADHINNGGKPLPVSLLQMTFQLMEEALDISGLIDIAMQLLEQLVSLRQITTRQSLEWSQFMSDLLLYLVSVLRLFQPCILVCNEQILQLAKSLSALCDTVEKPLSCTSAERCLLAYFSHLIDICHVVKAKYSEKKPPMAFNKALAQFTSNHESVDETLFLGIFESNRNSSNKQSVASKLTTDKERYQFVFSAFVHLCNITDINKINDVAAFCCEVTAFCPALRTEFLGAVKSICDAKEFPEKGFVALKSFIKNDRFCIYENIAIFVAYMIVRQCFSLETFVVVAISSVLAPISNKNKEFENIPEARLTLYILVRLLRMPSTLSEAATFELMSSISDRLLLVTSYRALAMGPLLALLKAIAMLVDIPDEEDSEMPTVDPQWSMIRLKEFAVETSLNFFAAAALRSLSAMAWVRETCLKEPEVLIHAKDYLVDQMISARMALLLLQLLSYPQQSPRVSESVLEESEHEQFMSRILAGLARWTMRVAWLELQLIINYTSALRGEALATNLAKATIEVFQLSIDNKGPSTRNKKNMPPQKESGLVEDREVVWLVAPLIGKLSPGVQGAVLTAASNMLDKGGCQARTSKADKEKSVRKSFQLLSHAPFLSLVLTCLRGQDEQREAIQSSLQTQFNQFMNAIKDLRNDDAKKNSLLEGLHLRLSLLGNLFYSIQRSNPWVLEWIMVLVNLITQETVTPHENNNLFLTVLDMILVLLSGIENGAESDRKFYLSIVKKIRREIGDRPSEGVNRIRQLLPLQRGTRDIIRTEPVGTVFDTKGNKIEGIRSANKQQGLQVSGKEKLDPWTIIEGLKNVSSLSLSLFVAMRQEKRPRLMEIQQRLSQYHTHDLRRTDAYFMEPPSVPPEEDDNLPTKESVKAKKEKLTKNTRKPKTRRQTSRTGATTPVGGSGYPGSNVYPQPMTPAPSIVAPPTPHTPQGPGQVFIHQTNQGYYPPGDSKAKLNAHIRQRNSPGASSNPVIIQQPTPMFRRYPQTSLRPMYQTSFNNISQQSSGQQPASFNQSNQPVYQTQNPSGQMMSGGSSAPVGSNFRHTMPMYSNQGHMNTTMQSNQQQMIQQQQQQLIAMQRQRFQHQHTSQQFHGNNIQRQMNVPSQYNNY